MTHEKRELTDDDLARLMKESVPDAVRLPPGWKMLMRAVIAAHEALNADAGVMMQAPEGWKLAPMKPTQAMCQAAQESLREWPKFPFRVSPAYKAMLAAAPTPPDEQPEQQNALQNIPKLIPERVAEQQEPIIYKRSEFTKGWTTFNVRRECADAAEARLKGPDALAELRAKVMALEIGDLDGFSGVLLMDVLAEIDKMMGDRK